MRAKSIAIFLTVVVALIGVSLFQVDRAIYKDQVLGGEGGARGQLAALIPAIQGEFRLLSENFKTVAPQVLGKGTDFGDSQSARFEMVAKLRLENSGWVIAERAFHDKSGIKSWAENYTQIALKALKPRDIPLAGVALTALLDPQRKAFFLWIFRDENDQWYGAITRPDVFQSVLDRQKGQLTNVFVVNTSGQVLGHTTAEYVGTILKDDPVVAELMATQKKQGVGQFKGGDGAEIQGLYEQVPGTNVSVVLERPMKPLLENRSAARLQIVLMGVGLALFGLAAIFLSIKDSPRRQPVSPSPLPPSPVVAPTFSPPTAPAGDKGELMREKMKAYMTSSSALAREMHGPLIRILSQAQVLKAKAVGNGEVERIEQLAREARQIVLKLLAFAGEEDFAPEKTSVNEVLNRSLTVFEPKLLAKGVRLEKNLKRMPEIMAHPLALMKIFEVLFNNALEAMERMPNKVLKVSLEEEDSKLVLRMQDSGEGVGADQVGQVFDPFFTTKSPSLHSGLGLSTAYGLAREFGGEMLFESAPGKGSTVTLRFPIGAVAAVTAPPAKSPPPPPAGKSSPVPPLAAAPLAPRSAPLPSKAPPSAPSMDLDFNLELVGEFADSRPPASEFKDEFAAVPVNTAAPLIQEQAIQETLDLIDQMEPTFGSAPPPAFGAPLSQDVGPALPDEWSTSPVTRPVKPPPVKPPPPRSSVQTASGKIDRPQMNLKKNAPRVASEDVSIRKPGERK